MSTLIKNGRIVTAVDDYNADIFIEDEKITQIGKNLEMGADKVIDASNRLVIPGGIDPHTHFDMPFGGTMILRFRPKESRPSKDSIPGMKRPTARLSSIMPST